MLFGLTPEQQELQRRARNVADVELRPRAARIDQTEEFPFDNVQTLVRERFMGLTIPSQYGGGGRPVLDAVSKGNLSLIILGVCTTVAEPQAQRLCT
jgi:alkylation response protein AidB-like acyl-CoA dehydrogenase